MQLPSASSQRYLMVPSLADTCFRAALGTVRAQVSPRRSRRERGRLDISSKEVTPRLSQEKTCFPRKAGSPMLWRNARSSGRVMDLISVMVPPQTRRVMRQM